MAPFPDTCSAVLPMSAQDYFIERDSASFRALMSEVLDLGDIDWCESWTEGNKRYHKLVTKPDYERWVPKIGRKYVKPSDLDFYDIIEYDPEKLKEPPYRLDVVSELQLLGDKLQAHRQIVIEEIDATHCRHSVVGSVKVQIFGIGRLAEKGVIDSSVKTFQQLPHVLDRYLAVRNDMLKTEQGRALLLEGRPPNMADIDQQVVTTLQAPYPRGTDDSTSLEATSAEEASSSSSDEEEDREPVAAPAQPERLQRAETIYHDTGPQLARAESMLQESPRSASRKLTRQETLYFDVGEEILDKDALWVPEETGDIPPEKMQRYQSTRHALKHDRKRMRRAMHKLKARSREFFVSELGVDLTARRIERAQKHGQPSAEDLSSQSSWNAQRQQWREFWKGTHVQSVPVPNMSGRLLQLVTFGQATGWVQMRGNRSDSVASEMSAASVSPRQASASELEPPASAFSEEKGDESAATGKKGRRSSKLIRKIRDQLKMSK